MSNHFMHRLAQSQITTPRDSITRGAKVDSTTLSTADNGKLYKLLNINDQSKFQLEKSITRPLSAPPRSTMPSRHSNTTTKPNRNIINLSKLPAKKASTSSSSTHRSPPPYRPYKGQEISPDNNNTLLKPPTYSKTVPIIIDESNVIDITVTMKEKYEENINVINQLLSEKQKMEKRMKMLENKVRRSQTGLSTSPNSKKEKNKNDLLASDEIDLKNETTRRRSLSAGSAPKVSDKLLISQMQYIEKRRSLEAQEKQKQMEEEKLLNDQKERYLRASIHGKAFTEMLARTEKAKAISHEKMMKAKMEEDKKLKKAIQDKRRHRIEKEEKLKTAALTEKTWETIVKEEEQLRSERIQKRKAELQLLSNAPACASLTPKRVEPKSSGQAELSQMFVAEDPSRVASRLARQKQAWERKLLEDQEKARRLEEQRALKQRNVPVATAVLSMQAREQVAAERQKERELAKKKKLEEEEKKKLDAEKKKMEKALKETIPDSARRLTKSAENRAKIVRQQKEREEREAKEAEIAKKKKEKHDREIAAVVTAEVREKEYQRKFELHKKSSKEPFELIDVQKAADIKKMEAKESFLQNLKANKKRIHEVMQSRLSLIERHEKQIAARARGTAALITVANAISETKTNKDDDYDFLDMKEQLIYKNSKTMM